MTKNRRTRRLITETLALRPHQPLVAREIRTILYDIYNQSASPKQISKYIITLQDNHPQIQRIKHTTAELGVHGCRFTYKWDTTTGLVVLNSC